MQRLAPLVGRAVIGGTVVDVEGGGEVLDLIEGRDGLDVFWCWKEGIDFSLGLLDERLAFEASNVVHKALGECGGDRRPEAGGSDLIGGFKHFEGDIAAHGVAHHKDLVRVGLWNALDSM